jgi:hypothetical protein
LEAVGTVLLQALLRLGLAQAARHIGVEHRSHSLRRLAMRRNDDRRSTGFHGRDDRSRFDCSRLLMQVHGAALIRVIQL